MSHHHHHPHEGHRSGDSPGGGKRRRGPFFYIAGVFLLLALLGFIVSGNLAWFGGTAKPSTAPVLPNVPTDK